MNEPINRITSSLARTFIPRRELGDLFVQGARTLGQGVMTGAPKPIMLGGEMLGEATKHYFMGNDRGRDLGIIAGRAIGGMAAAQSLGRIASGHAPWTDERGLDAPGLPFI